MPRSNDHKEILEAIRGSSPKGGNGTTYAERAIIETTDDTFQALEKLNELLEKYDKSSTKLSKNMLCLTRVIAFLTVVYTVATIIMLSKM